MPSIRMLLVGLLALGKFADAKHKDKILVSKFARSDCQGHPLGKQMEVQKDKCVLLQGGSVKPQNHTKVKYGHWVHDVKAGKMDCIFTVFHNPNCDANGLFVEVNVPAELDGCTELDTDQSSVMFTCALHKPLDQFSVGVPGISQVAHSVGLPKISKTSYTINVSATPKAYVHSSIDVSVDSTIAIISRAEPTANSLDSRKEKEYHVKGVWLKHPWVDSDICYKCWTSKELDYGKLKCRSGPKYPIDCGPKPAAVPLTTTVTSHVTDVVEYYFTTTNDYLAAQTSAHGSVDGSVHNLDKRGWHTPVLVENPYIPGQWLCADAEWENRGKPKAEVRLQKFKMMDPHGKCSGKHFKVLNFDKAFEVTTATAFASLTTTLTHVPTWVPAQPTLV